MSEQASPVISVIVGERDLAGWAPYRIMVESLVSAEQASRALEDRFNAIIGDKAAMIRVPPRVESNRDFATDTLIHRGYARFLLSEQPGDRKQVERPEA